MSTSDLPNSLRRGRHVSMAWGLSVVVRQVHHQNNEDRALAGVWRGSPAAPCTGAGNIFDPQPQRPRGKEDSDCSRIVLAFAPHRTLSRAPLWHGTGTHDSQPQPARPPWSPSRKARPSSRSPIARSLPSQSSASDGQTSQSRTHVLVSCPQSWVAGHLQDTVYRVVRSLNRSFASAWMHQYVYFCQAMSCAKHCTDLAPARHQPEEEQHQLPLVEDVP